MLSSGLRARGPMQLARQALFQIAPVGEPGQRVMDGLLAELRPQPEIGQAQFDPFADRHGQAVTGGLVFVALGIADDAQQAQGLPMHRQRHAQVAGARFVDEMTAEQARLRIRHFIGLTAPHGPAFFEGEESLRQGVLTPARDGLEKLIPRAQARETAALAGEELDGHQGDDLVGLLLCGAGLKKIVHPVEQPHVMFARLELGHDTQQLVVGFSQVVGDVLAVRDVANVALNDSLARDQVDVAHEFDVPLLTPLRFQREILVADVLVVLQLPEGDLALGDIFELADFPERLAQHLVVGVPQHVGEIGVDVGDLSAFRIQNQDPVFRGLEETAVSKLGFLQRVGDPLELGEIGVWRSGVAGEAAALPLGLVTRARHHALVRPGLRRWFVWHPHTLVRESPAANELRAVGGLGKTRTSES